ncbi:MAG: 50S ribosomal protein L20 [bacterium]|nr:50S ribosomal protein L20 [bacterium]
MTRGKSSVASRDRRRRVLKAAQGYRGSRRRLYRAAKEAVMHARMYAYTHRRTRKRDFRRLWIARINAATRQLGIPYSRFISMLKGSGVELNRKVLAEIAATNSVAFGKIVDAVRQ